MKNPDHGAQAPEAGAPLEDRATRHAPAEDRFRPDTASGPPGRAGVDGRTVSGSDRARTADALGGDRAEGPDGQRRPEHDPAEPIGEAARTKDGKRRRRRRRKTGGGPSAAAAGPAASACQNPRPHSHALDGAVAPGSADAGSTGAGSPQAATGSGGEIRTSGPADADGARVAGARVPGQAGAAARPAPGRSKSRKRRQRARRAKALRQAAAGLPDAPEPAAANGDGRSAGPVPSFSNGPAHEPRHGGGPGNGQERQRPVAPPENRAAAGAAPRQPNGTPLYAALDLGTNNCRLLVAAPTRPGQFRVVDAFSRIVRLGEGLAASGRLSDQAMDRAVEALRVCAAKLADRPVRRARLIATEACRAAENGPDFLERVRRETGLDLEIVDRETEARLAVSGCSSLVERGTDSVVLFDIGGGSSEIAVIDLPGERSGRLANHIRAWTSLPVGVVTLSERFGGREVTRDTFAAMVADVETMLASFLAPDLPGMKGGEKAGTFHLIGTSGTVTTLAGVHLDLPRYDRRRVDGLWLTSEEVDRMLERILSWDFDQRSANPCIGADRADLVLAGCAILEGIRKRWPAERLRVADRGLREGLLTEMMAADGVWRRRRVRFPASDRSRFRTGPDRPNNGGGNGR